MVSNAHPCFVTGNILPLDHRATVAQPIHVLEDDGAYLTQPDAGAQNQMPTLWSYKARTGIVNSHGEEVASLRPLNLLRHGTAESDLGHCSSLTSIVFLSS